MIEYMIEPMVHQRAEVDTYGAEPYRGIWWDMGTGKTKATIDCLCKQHKAGQIEVAIILSPNDLRFEWMKEWRKNATVEYQYLEVSTRYLTTKKFQQKFSKFLMKPGLLIIGMSFDTFMSKNGAMLSDGFTEKRKYAFVVDEAQKIKSPTAQRTKAVLKKSRAAASRRALTGTLIANGCPFDAYAPVRFVDPDFWKREINVASYAAFKRRYAIWETGYASHGEYPKLVRYKNMDELRQLLAKIGTRVLKSDVLDLEDKVYLRVPFEMTPKQRKLYEELRSKEFLMLESGDTITPQHRLVLNLRLTQIVCGYAVTDDGATVDIDTKNPRFRAAHEIVEDCMSEQCVIWCRFDKDVDMFMEALKGRVVRFDGKVKDGLRQENKEAFQRGDVQFMAGKTSVGGPGNNFQNCHNAMYYSQDYSLENRLQSEDRFHRSGQTEVVTLTDVFALGTIDEDIVNCHQTKKEISDYLLGDEVVDRDFLYLNYGVAKAG